jgi:hypothetical protein
MIPHELFTFDELTPMLRPDVVYFFVHFTLFSRCLHS